MDFLSKACASHYERLQMGMRHSAFIYPKKFHWDKTWTQYKGSETFVGMLSIDLLLLLLMDAVRLEAPTADTSFMVWAICILGVYSGSYQMWQQESRRYVGERI